MKPMTIPCLRAVIGDWVYYSTLMSASEISSRIKTAKEIREAKSLDDFLQRTLKDRKKYIADYIETHKSRFFNSIIVGVFDAAPNWYQFDLTDALKKLRVADGKTIQDSMGILTFHGKEKMFAIDGQHRVEGIKIAFKAQPKSVHSDQYSIIFVAHVDDKEGKVRTRRLFSDINKRAVRVSNGDKVVIDEDDLCALVARRLYADYEYFEGGELISLTEKERLEENDVEHFTNLLTLYSVNKKLRALYKKRRGTSEFDVVNVEQFGKLAKEFYDFVIRSVSSYQRFFIKKTISLKAQRDNNRNVLFRPIGLTLLAKLYVYFHKHQALDFLAKNLNAIRCESPGGHFDRILWNAGKIEARSENQTAAFGLCLHLLRRLDAKESNALREKLKTITKNPNYSLPATLI